jgi:hypothetical protein
VVVRTADDISEGTPAVQMRPGQPAKLELIPPDWSRKTLQGPGSFSALRMGNPNGDPDRMPAPVPMQDD